MKRMGILLLCMLFLLSACAEGEAAETQTVSEAEETYQIDDMQITLDNSFSIAFLDGYVACFTAPHTDIFIVKEEFELEEGLEDLTLEAYGESVIRGNELGEDVNCKTDGDLTYFDYTSQLASGDFHYYTYLYKSTDAFWMVQFVVPEEYLASLWDDVTVWAQSVTFSEQANQAETNE